MFLYIDSGLPRKTGLPLPLQNSNGCKSFYMAHHEREDKLIVKSALIIFLLAFLLPFILTQVHNHKVEEMGFKMVDMLFICGTILLAIKLAREGWDMAAAGFTILGIGWGVIFAAKDFELLKMDHEVRTSAAYFFLPCMILIAFYRPFPGWIKLLTLWCFVPFTIALICFKAGIGNEKLVVGWMEVGFFSFHLTSLIWSIFFYLQWRKQLKTRKTAA